MIRLKRDIGMNIDLARQKIKPNDRIIMSGKNILPLSFPVDQSKEKSRRGKPNGLWYAIGTEWIDWVKSENPERMIEWNFIYKIKIVDSNMCIIKNSSQMEEFHKKYSYKQTDSAQYSDIKWSLVAKEYSGIEISPYQEPYRFKFLWYYGWDVASGCIWDKSGISHIYRIKI